MKRSIALFIAFLFTLQIQAQWQWAKRGGGIREDNSSDICVDANGDAYMIGYNYYIPGIGGEAYATFDSDTVFTNGANEVFLVKYSGSNGSVIWAKGIGANNSIPTGSSCDNCEKGYKVKYDPVNNCIYATGIFYGLATFGSTTIGGFNSLFISRLDLSGNYSWTKSIDVNYSDYIGNYDIKTDNVGNVYISGAADDSIHIGSVNLPKGGYLVKYNSQGTCIWAKGFTNAALIRFELYQNDIYAIGGSHFTGNTMTIGSNTYTLSTSGAYQNAFTIRMDTLMNVKWVNFMNASIILPQGFVTDTTGLYFGGVFQGSMTVGTSTLTTAGSTDMFLIKCDSAGNFRWTKTGNANNFVNLVDMLKKDGASFYTVGRINGSANFGSCGHTSVNSGYLTLFDSSGACLSSILLNGGVMDMDSAGSLFFTSTFTNSITIGTYTLTGDQYGEVFVAKRNGLTGIEERQSNSNNNTLVIYANPTAGKCNISIPDDFLYENNLTLQVYDVMGRLLQNAKIEVRQDEIKLNLEAEAKGVYNVILSNGKKNYTGKIIFE